MSTAFDFSYTDIQGRQQPMAQWQGRVVLLVNVASRCGFTPQYTGLESLWQRYRDQGLVVIGFPCNQFGNQEPGDAAQIQSFCQLDYGVSFPLAAKIQVKGAQADPLWQWLGKQKRGLLGTRAIKWNFTKFLVARDGQVVRRYSPTRSPAQLEADILHALQAV
jgi:glutathione peroxidase